MFHLCCSERNHKKRADQDSVSNGTSLEDIRVLSPSVLGYQAHMPTKIVFIIEHYDAFLSALKFTLTFPICIKKI